MRNALNRSTATHTATVGNVNRSTQNARSTNNASNSVEDRANHAQESEIPIRGRPRTRRARQTRQNTPSPVHFGHDEVELAVPHNSQGSTTFEEGKNMVSMEISGNDFNSEPSQSDEDEMEQDEQMSNGEIEMDARSPSQHGNG